jgi:hypothetical protein
VHTLKSLKIIKMERTVSFEDCKLPPKMQVMPPTPMNTLYLPTLSPKPRSLASGLVLRDGCCIRTKRTPISLEEGPWRLSWKW